MFQNGPCFRTIERDFFNLCFEKIYFCSFMKFRHSNSIKVIASNSILYLSDDNFKTMGYLKLSISFSCIQDLHFWNSSQIWGVKKHHPPLLPKMCHTYSAMIKLGTVIPYLKKIQQIYESRDTPLVFCCHQHFFIGNQQILVFVISRNAGIDRILIRNF